MSSADAIGAPLLVVIVDVIVFIIVGRLGRRSTGAGTKYEPFTGGESEPPTRGLYQSGLFVFATLFLVVEAFALLLAGSFLARSNFYPFLFLLGGSSVITVSIWWLILAGGGKF